MIHIMTSKDELWDRFGEIVRCIRGMLRRTGHHGQSAQTVMDMMLRHVEEPTGFIGIDLDEKNKITCLLFAVAVTPPGDIPWIEVVALWSRPMRATQLKREGFDHLARWAKSLGANKIVTVVTRSPENFYSYFHEELGFEKVGILLERRL